mgnify:CR=1 FL=1
MQCKKGRGRVELPQQHHPHWAVLLLRATSSSRMCCAKTIAERTQQLRTYIPTHGVCHAPSVSGCTPWW